MITINNNQSAPEKVVGITNLTPGLWEYYCDFFNQNRFMYVTKKPVACNLHKTIYNGCVMISFSGIVESCNVEYLKWHKVTFTRSTKSITLSN